MTASRPVLSLSLGLVLLSLLAACSDGGSGPGASAGSSGAGDVPGSCTSNSQCGAGYTCQLQSAPGTSPPGTTLTDCDPFEDPFCEPGPGGEGGSFPGPPGAGGSFPGEEGGTSSEGEGGSFSGGGTSSLPGGSGPGGTTGSGQGGGQAASGKCVAIPTGAGGKSGGQGGTGSSQGGTSAAGTSSQGGSDSAGGSSSQGGSGPGSCNGDFSLGKNAVVQGDLSTWGKACNGAAPTNCPDGYFVDLGASCVCVVACSSLNGSPQPGDACVSSEGVCAKVQANNGNTATLCVPTSLNLCTSGTSGTGGSSSGQGGSGDSGSGGSESGGSPQCSDSGASCEDDSECCSGTCSFNECF